MLHEVCEEGGEMVGKMDDGGDCGEYGRDEIRQVEMERKVADKRIGELFKIGRAHV